MPRLPEFWSIDDRLEEPSAPESPANGKRARGCAIGPGAEAWMARLRHPANPGSGAAGIAECRSVRLPCPQRSSTGNWSRWLTSALPRRRSDGRRAAGGAHPRRGAGRPLRRAGRHRSPAYSNRSRSAVSDGCHSDRSGERLAGLAATKERRLVESSPRIRALNASYVPFSCRLEASGNLAVSASPG